MTLKRPFVIFDGDDEHPPTLPPHRRLSRAPLVHSQDPITNEDTISRINGISHGINIWLEYARYTPKRCNNHHDRLAGLEVLESFLKDYPRPSCAASSRQTTAIEQVTFPVSVINTPRSTVITLIVSPRVPIRIIRR